MTSRDDITAAIYASTAQGAPPRANGRDGRTDPDLCQFCGDDLPDGHGYDYCDAACYRAANGRDTGRSRIHGGME